MFFDASRCVAQATMPVAQKTTCAVVAGLQESVLLVSHPIVPGGFCSNCHRLSKVACTEDTEDCLNSRQSTFLFLMCPKYSFA